MIALDEPCPLPNDPMLAELATAYEQAGAWIVLYDPAWRLVYMNDECRLAQDGRGSLAPLLIGADIGSTDNVEAWLAWRYGGWTLDGIRHYFAGHAGRP